MEKKKSQLAILCYLWKKGVSTRAAAKEMNDVEIQELLKKMWHETGSDISRKVMSASKTNLSQGDLLSRPCLKWLNSQQALLHCWKSLVLHKLPSINNSLGSALWIGSEIAWNIAKNFIHVSNLKNPKK